MKAGRFRAGQAKAATKAFQVADHSGLAAYTSGEIGPQTVGIAELVTTHDEHWVNGYDLGQQPDGRKWRHATRTPFASSGSVRIITTPLAKYGDKVAEIPNGDWLYQVRSADIIPDYRTLVFSVYARKVSASNGTLALDWAIDEETLTVTDATVDTITDSSKSWGVNDYQNMYALVCDGDGEFQHRLIASNTATKLTLDSDLGMIPAIGDAIDIVDWTSPTMRRVDELTGAVVSSATVRAYADWERFFAVFRPTSTFNRLYSRIRSVSGTLWVDGAKLEKASKLEAGISTSSTATTLTDTNRGWVDDAHLNCQIIILDGDDVGDCQTIADNDQTSHTASFATTPSAISTYIILPSNANLRPTPYLDLNQISASFQEVSAYDLYTGTLLVGGGLSDAPRVVIEDADGNVILKMGDYGKFKGIRFLRGACASFEGGYIIMRADQGHDDAGQRIRMSHRGIEGFSDTDVRTFGLYPTGQFELTLGTSPLQERIVISQEMGIAAIDADGKTWWDVNPAEHWFWIGEPGSDNWLKFTSADGLKFTGYGLVDNTVTSSKIATGPFDISGPLQFDGVTVLDMNEDNDLLVGYYAGDSLTSAGYNLFAGYCAGYGVSTGGSNTFLGTYAGYSGADPSTNVLIGMDAGFYIDDSYDNVVIGYDAGFGVTGNDYYSNVFIGKEAAYGITTGYLNVVLGYQAGYDITAGIANVIVGAEAAKNLTIGDFNTFVGYAVAAASAITGDYNVALGYDAASHLTSGTYNTHLGSIAGTAIDAETYTTFVGAYAGSLTTASYNTFVGGLCGQKCIAGQDNVAMGYQAGRYINGGDYNVLLGHEAGLGVDGNDYDNNVFVGYQAGRLITIGGNNLCLGFQAGDNLTSGGSNIIIGAGINAASATGSNQLSIGDILQGTLGASGNLTVNAPTVSAHYDLMLAGDGVLGLKETATPTADASYGKVYCKNDNLLYFQSGDGVEHQIAFA